MTKKTFNPNHPSPIVVSVCDGGCGVGSGEAAGTVNISHSSIFFSSSDKIILFL